MRLVWHLHTVRLKLLMSSDATRVESFDDLAQLNAFSSIERRQRGNPQKLAFGNALAVKDPLAKIRDSMAVPDDELHRAASFFKSL
jgi:hypothetical protein